LPQKITSNYLNELLFPRSFILMNGRANRIKDFVHTSLMRGSSYEGVIEQR
jgi:hypothetical protein